MKRRCVGMVVTCLLLVCGPIFAEDAIDKAADEYQKALEAADAEHTAKVKALRDEFLSRLKEEMKAAASRGDMAAAQKASEKAKQMGGQPMAVEAGNLEIKKAEPPKAPPPPPLQPPGQAAMESGLLVTEFARQPLQDGGSGYVPLEKLGDAVGVSRVISSVEDWKFSTDRNAKAEGFLKIDQPGVYAFKSWNWQSRMTLYVNGKQAIKYGSAPDVGMVVRVTLPAGYIPFLSIGYVGTHDNVLVRWQPPGEKELTVIPPDRLFHQQPAKK